MQGMPALLCLLLLLIQPAQAAPQPDILITPQAVNLTDFAMSYYVDREVSAEASAEATPAAQEARFQQIRRQRFTPSGNKLSLGTGAKNTWARIRIRNLSDHSRRLFLHHPYAYHNRKVVLYEPGPDGWQRRQLHLDQVSDSPYMYRGSAVFEFQLAPGEHKTLYVQSLSFSHQWFSLLLLDEEHSRRELIGTHNDIALMVGMLLALVIYNVLLYFTARQKEYIFYSLYLVSGLIWIALSYGLLANFFALYGSWILPLHLSLLTMPSFLILFMMDIFRTRQKHPKEHRWLQFILLLLVADLIYGAFDIIGALRPASSLAALMMAVTMGVTLSLMRKGDPLAKYFLLGHGLFVLFSSIAVLFYKGLVEFNYLTSHGVGIGIMLESLMLAFIISYRIKLLEAIKASQAELRLQAITDPMTRLHNRRYFYTEAAYQWQQAQEQNTPLSLLMLDIDHFKAINDTQGHAIGDAVIEALADQLRAHSRPGDLLARFGGEEFVVLLPDTALSQLKPLAERLRQSVQEMQITGADGEPVPVTISIGGTEICPAQDSVEEALNLADIALYQAKHSGRNCVQLAENHLATIRREHAL